MGSVNFPYAISAALFAHGHRRTQSGEHSLPADVWLLSRCYAVMPNALSDLDARLEPAPVEQQVLLVADMPFADEAWRPLLVVVS